MVFILDFLEGDMFVAPPLQQDMPEKLSIAMPVNQRHLNAVAALSLSTTHVRHDSLSLSLSLLYAMTEARYGPSMSFSTHLSSFVNFGLNPSLSSASLSDMRCCPTSSRSIRSLALRILLCR